MPRQRLTSASSGGGGGQPADSDLTTIAAIDSTVAGALVTDGAGWIRKSYAQLKTALSLDSVDNTSDANKPVSTAQGTAIAARELPLIPTAVKTGAYTAAAQDLVPVDTTSGAVTITLPTAPVDKTQVAVKHVIQGSTNAVTIALGGSDVLNRTGGATSMTLPLLAQAAVLQYKATGAIWYVVEDDLPLSQLDLRYAATGDSRLSDARTPTAHAASHLPGGSDPLTGRAKLYILTSDAVNTTTTAATVGNLTSASLPAGSYEFEVQGQTTQDTNLTSGAQQWGFAFSGTTTQTQFVAQTFTASTSSRNDAYYSSSFGAPAGGGNSGTVGTKFGFRVKGSMVVSVAGTLSFQFANASASRQITAYTGTVMTVTPVLG